MRYFSDAKRILIKIGTNSLSKDGKIDTLYVREIARQIQTIYLSDRELVIITSGAIGMGAGRLSISKKIKKIQMRQACAAIGQPLLMHEYHMAFSSYNIPIAQVLLTTDVLNNRKSYVNLQNAIETLLHMKVIPILNENDCISTEEIGNAFGDNDRLSALIASKLDADLLIMLTDIDALYDKDPRKSKDAKPISLVKKITEEIEKNAGGSGSTFSTGGMKTKIDAAKIVIDAGCKMVLANGKENDIITRIIEGEEIGTLFLPKQRLARKTRWILNSAPLGSITVDEGAMKAIKNKKSLLPSGITHVEGVFKAGSVILINNKAKAVTSLSSEEIKQLMGKHSKEIRTVLGHHRRDVAALAEDIVFLTE